MPQHANPVQQTEPRSAVAGNSAARAAGGAGLIVDNRPEVVAQRVFQERVQGNNRTIQFTHGEASSSSQGGPPPLVDDSRRSEIRTDRYTIRKSGLDEDVIRILQAMGYEIQDTLNPTGPTGENANSPTLDEKTFYRYFTLLPGLKYSKSAQDFKKDKTPEYNSTKARFTSRYKSILDRFNFNFPTQPGYLPTDNPESALKTLDVMHPKSKLEGLIIKDLDKVNTDLNTEIAKKLPALIDAEKNDGKIDTTMERASGVEEEGGIAAEHSAAFRKMIKMREHGGSLLIRPAGNHAIEKLKENYPAKPLWIKGKTVDFSKFNETEFNLLGNLFLKKDGATKDDFTKKIEDLSKMHQGQISFQQMYSKKLRGVNETDLQAFFNKKGKEHVPADFVEKVIAWLEDVDAELQDMRFKNLVADNEGFVASPNPIIKDKSTFTGDYDIYSISHALSDDDKLTELQRLRNYENGTRGKVVNGENRIKTYDKKKLKDKLNKDAYTPMADQDDEFGMGNKAPHKLFGNISRYEMGMKIDLNSAAITWAGYQGGQVIKHGTEAHNTLFPQDISDGIVSLSQDSVKYDKSAKDDEGEKDADGNVIRERIRFHNPKLLEAAAADEKIGYHLPLNKKLLETRATAPVRSAPVESGFDKPTPRPGRGSVGVGGRSKTRAQQWEDDLSPASSEGIAYPIQDTAHWLKLKSPHPRGKSSNKDSAPKFDTLDMQSQGELKPTPSIKSRGGLGYKGRDAIDDFRDNPSRYVPDTPRSQR